MGNNLYYSFLKKDGHTVTAASPMFPGSEGIPSHWNSYINVDDVDALPDRVTAAGGKVIAPPFDVFDAGRMMAVQDPTGAMVNFWTARNHIGAYMVNAPGAMVWNEMATRDMAAAQAFFGSVLGWTFEEGDMPFYHYIRNGGRLNGGMVQMDENWGEIPPHWQVYFAVADIDAVAKRVPELGGQILSGVDESPVGRFAIIAEPTGAMFAVIQLKQTTPWLESAG
jgi:predicted enzyme related to lactoylglutathione lyase